MYARPTPDPHDADLYGRFAAPLRAVGDTDAHPHEARVTVVLVAYNDADHIEQLASSLAASTVAPYEIIVVDNGSTDGTPDLMAAEIPEALLLTGIPSDGFGAACNRAAALTDSDVIVFLNSDLDLAPTCIAELLAAMASDDSVGAAMAKLYTKDERATLNASAGDSHFLGFGWNRDCLLGDVHTDDEGIYDVGFPCGAAFAVRREAFMEIGGFDESFFMYMEDVDLGWRLRVAGWRTVVAAAAHAWHDYSFFTQDRRFCYFAERNRLTMILSTLPAWLLVLSLPLALCVELVVFGYAMRERWAREKARAWWHTARDARTVLKRRKRVRSTALPGATWLLAAPLTGRMSSPHLRHPLVRIGNAVLAPAWAALRAIARSTRVADTDA